MTRSDDPKRETALRRLDALGHVLDSAIRVPGTRFRFGADAVVGLVPGLGDAAGALMSAYIVVQAARLGAPVPSLVRMVLNVAVEAGVGAIPFAGDLFDAAFKANLRNLAILRHEMERPGSTRRSSAGVLLAVIVALVLILGAMGWLAFTLARTLWQALT